MKLLSLTNEKILALILLIAFVLRLSFVLYAGTGFAMEPDSHHYDALAVSLLEGNGFNGEMSRPPVYPLILAGLYRIFGHQYAAVTMLQAVLGMLTVFLVFRIAAPLMGRNAALLCALIAALDPFAVYFTGKLLTETLFTFFLCYIVFLLSRFNFGERVEYGRYVLLALAMGLTTLLRPEMLGFACFLLPAYAGYFLLRRMPLRHLSGFILVIFVTYLMALPWAVRNHGLSGRWLFTTTRGGWTFYEGLAEDYSIEGWDRHRARMTSMLERNNLAGELAVDDYFSAEARRFVVENPARFAVLSVRKLFKMYRPLPYEVYSGAARFVSASYFLPLLVLFIAGVYSCRKEWRLFPLYLPVVFITLLHMVFTSQIRYRVPLHPLLCVVAVLGLLAIARQAGLIPARDKGQPE